MGADNETVARLHEKLRTALRQARRQPDAPVTVAEIYQELVPYRTVRADVGFAMNADYEHTLLRLLAGEGGHVRLEPAEARDAIRSELRGSNPNVGMYREFAACDVWVSSDDAAGASTRAMIDALGADIDDDAADVITSVATFAMADDVDAADVPDMPDVPDVPDATHARRDTSREQATSQAAAIRCAYCDSTLPTQRALRFCPFCGADQTTRPCEICGESLEPGWTYCIACGGARGEASP